VVQIPAEFVGKPKGYPQELPSAEVRRRFLALLGEFEPAAVPLDLRVTAETLLPGDIVQQRVEYDVAPGERVPAFHLCRRDLPADAPGVLSIHAHGGEDIFPVGKAYHCRPLPADPVQYGYRAAVEGFRVLAPDALCFGERRTAWGYSSLFFDEIATHAELTGRGRSLAWKSVWDNSRAIEVLESLGTRRIGSLGWSGGSTQNYILAAVNTKLRAAVCYFSFMTLRHQFYQYRLGHCLYHYVPGMVAAGIDWDQVAALAAPRKLFLGWGALDEGTPAPMYHAFVQAIRERCRNEGLPDSVVVHGEPQCGHQITEAMLRSSLQFLRQELTAP